MRTWLGLHLEVAVGVVRAAAEAQVHQQAAGLLQLHDLLETLQHRQLRPHAHVRQLQPPARPERIENCGSRQASQL